MAVLIDSYSESNESFIAVVVSPDQSKVGQVFKNTYNRTLDSCKFNVGRDGSVSGNVYVQVYKSGPYPSGVQGSALATSDPIDILTFPVGSQTLKTFTFSGANRINLSPNTYYAVLCCYDGGNYSENSYVRISTDNTSPTHPDHSLLYKNGVWYNGGSLDVCFYVYGDPAKPLLSSSACTNIYSNKATANGNITDTGGSSPTVRGFCYMTGTSGDPTTANSKVSESGTFGTGAYSLDITGLTHSTNYRVRPYATNSVGTAYGTTVQLTTLSNSRSLNLSDSLKVRESYYQRKLLNQEGLFLVGTYGGWYAGGNYFAGSPEQPSDVIEVNLFDGVSLRDVKTSQTQRGLFEGIILSDSISKVLGAFRSFVEGINVSDSISKVFHGIKGFVESVVVTDTMGKVGTYVRSLVESINVADSITKSISYVRSFVDSIRATDFIQTTRQSIVNLVDSILAVDTVAKRAIKSLKESINVSDTLSRLLTASRGFVDSIVASDVVVKLTRLKTFVDNMSITDFVSKVIGKVVSSAITVADTFSRTVDYIRTFVDTFNITDIIDILQGTILNFVDHIVARDNIVKTVGKYLTDTVEMLDDLVRGFFVSLSDTIKAIDDFHIAQTFKVFLTEIIQVSDLISKHANILLTSVVKILDNRFTRRLNGQLITWGKQVRKVLEWAKVIKKQDQYIKVIKKDSQEWNKEEKNFGSYQSLKKASDDWTKLKKE